MKYIVNGELMEFFNAESAFDLSECSIDGEYSVVELCEIGGSVLYSETGNFRLACWYVVALAIATGCEGLLRMEVSDIAEEYFMQIKEIENAEG